MDKFLVKESGHLSGRVNISGSKNAALPILAACLLTDEESVLSGIPALSDCLAMKSILESLGAKVIRNPLKNTLVIRPAGIKPSEVPYELVSAIRASFLVMGPLLARFKSSNLAMPGGCNIGLRPLDLHLKGFAALGAKVENIHGQITATAESLVGDKIYLDFPSVGATENIMMAASLALGVTIIENAATEPEIVDLANFLNNMGANVKGAGTNTIKITGVERLRGANYSIMPDRIEAGTLMAAVAAKGGKVFLEGISAEHLKPVIAKLREMNVGVIEDMDGLWVVSEGSRSLSPTEIKTMPHPGFPTDLQAPFTSVLALTHGSSMVCETVFENRFMHVPELLKMGANIKIASRNAMIEGVKYLSSARVAATDLRAGAALVIAAICAEGVTEIGNVHHIDRGYYRLEEKLGSLGARIERVHGEVEMGEVV